MKSDNELEILMHNHEIKDNAANIIKTTKKLVEEFADSLELKDKLVLEGAISELKNALIANDIEQIEEKAEVLKAIAIEVSDKIYDGHIDNAQEFEENNENDVKDDNKENDDTNAENKKSDDDKTKKSSKEDDSENEDDAKPDKKKKNKKGKKSDKKDKKKWKDFSKKKKALIIIIPIVIIILIILSYFLFIRKDNVLNEDNYYYKNGVLYFKNSDGMEIGKYKCQNKNADLCMVANEFDDDKFDKVQNVLKNNQKFYVRSKIYYDRYVFIFDNSKKSAKKIILYDIKKSKNLKTFYGVKSYVLNKKNYIVVRNKKNKQFIIDINKNKIEVSKDVYDYIGIITKNKSKLNYIIKNDEVYSILDSSKVSLYEGKGIIKNYNDDYVVISDDNEYKLIDYKGNEKDSKADYISLYNDFYVYIKDNIMNLYTYDKVKLIPEDIKLNNKYYNKINTIKDGKVVSSKQAFSISYKNNEINITVYKNNKKTTKKFDLNELLLNSKLSYYSYSDKNLYFYKDKEKTELLGKYTCSNKNTITKDSNKLNSCYIFSSSNFKEHIFSSRYVFVKDGNNVNLYDISTSKTLNTYSDLKASVNNNFYINDIVYVTVIDNSNKQGLIKIQKSNIDNLINPKYEFLEMINEKYVKVKENSSYKLLDINGKNLTANYKNNFYAIKNSSSRYEVYSFESNRQISGEFTNVKFYDKYVAVVNDNNILLLYNYNADRLIDGVGVASKSNFDITDNGSTTVISSGGNSYVYNNSSIPWLKINKGEENE